VPLLAGRAAAAGLQAQQEAARVHLGEAALLAARMLPSMAETAGAASWCKARSQAVLPRPQLRPPSSVSTCAWLQGRRLAGAARSAAPAPAPSSLCLSAHCRSRLRATRAPCPPSAWHNWPSTGAAAPGPPLQQWGAR
jgi:hypothetical protein